MIGKKEIRQMICNGRIDDAKQRLAMVIADFKNDATKQHLPINTRRDSTYDSDNRDIDNTKHNIDCCKNNIATEYPNRSNTNGNIDCGNDNIDHNHHNISNTNGNIERGNDNIERNYHNISNADRNIDRGNDNIERDYPNISNTNCEIYSHNAKDRPFRHTQNEAQEELTPDYAHYLMGNIHYKACEWKEAIEHYLEAVELNTNSPAKEKLEMTYQILAFYNKDIYGQ